MRYCDHSLGNTVKEVLEAFYAHPGEMDLKPFGFDVYQGFEFYRAADGKLYKTEPGARIELSRKEEADIERGLAEGGVEFYLRRPSASVLTPYLGNTRKMLHAATGRAMALEDPHQPRDSRTGDTHE